MKPLFAYQSKQLLIPGTILIAFVAGFGFQMIVSSPAPDQDINPACIEHYPLLRNDLDCKSADEDISRVQKIQTDITAYIEEQKAAGQVNRASVFFRDLNSRRFASVNADEIYIPGSLLKLPLAIAYFKLSEVEPLVLTQEFQYNPTTKDLNEIENWKPAEKLVIGKPYSVDALIAHTLIYSDNETAALLAQSIDQTFFRRVCAELGVPLPNEGGSEKNFISAKTYASLLRALYLSSYLNIDNSQKILNLMSQASFSDGLKAGVPDNIQIAHKFGEREIVDSQTGKETSAQLHDCGIIYKPDHPYILCVMTEGKSSDALSAVIAEISKLIYESE